MWVRDAIDNQEGVASLIEGVGLARATLTLLDVRSASSPRTQVAVGHSIALVCDERIAGTEVTDPAGAVQL